MTPAAQLRPRLNEGAPGRRAEDLAPNYRVHVDRDELADIAARFRAIADGFDNRVVDADDDVRTELLRGVYLAARKALVVLR